MVRDLTEAAEILKEHGLDLTKLLQDTHCETMLRLGMLLDQCLELVLKKYMLKSGNSVNDKTFQKGGKLYTLGSKIKKAKDIGLLDEETHKDADTLREIRNEFGHLKAKVHFDSDRIVVWVKQLGLAAGSELRSQ
jgi:DNA-binding MltR family transcriptional regulator